MENNALDNDLYLSELKLIPASKGKRFANLIIDYIMAIVLATILFVLLDVAGMYFATNGIQSRLLGAFLFALYYMVTEGTLKGKSIGKFVTKTRAVNEDGSTMDMSTVVKRSFSRIVPFEPFSFLGSEASGWHDKWSNTIVIDES